MSENTDSNSRTLWPARVFDTPLLRALDTRGRRELEAAGRGIQTTAGQVLYRAGSVSDSLFVVVAGSVLLHEADSSDCATSEPEVVRFAQTFGEEAILRGSSRSSTAIVESAGAVERECHD